MSVTIPDSDGTVLALDEVVLDTLAAMHGAGPHLRMWRIGDPKGKWVLILDATTCTLVMSVLKVLVRKRKPRAYARIENGSYEIRHSDYLAHPRIAFARPTELQAWHAAWETIKEHHHASL